jgi:signal transduction histidine kinase
MMNREHDTIEEGHPACQGEECLELPLLSSRHLAALKTAAFRQGVTVGRLLRRLIRDYLAVLRERGLESETRRPQALAERFDGKFLRNRTGVGPRDGLILASEVFSELPRSGTGTNGLERSPRMLPANEEAERSSSPTEVARDRPETANNDPRADQALALLAHELRNPLGAIRMSLRMLHQVRDDPATRERVESVLDRQTRHMSRLIEGVLDLARIGLGKVQLGKERVDLARLVDVAFEAARHSLEERGHEVEVVLPPGPVILEADPTRLQEVLTNLLDNAAKYTAPLGRIGLTAVPEGDDIVFRVWDTGIGIAPEMLPHVFDLFWQSSCAAHHSGGLGIGLALVRQIVELHGGSISAFSAGPGQGSEFVVRLPRTTPTENRNGTLCADEV